jgi:DNA-binding NarL/FixJ family response regulator
MNQAAEAGKDALSNEEVNPATNRTTIDPSIETGRSETQIRVLIIDGHEAVRRALRVRLSVPRQFEVVGVSSDPDAAANQIERMRPDVVLFGLHSSSDDELAITVRAVHGMARRTAVVIVLAPYVDAVERELLMNAGAKRYLLKHIDSDQLIREIESVVASTTSA